MNNEHVFCARGSYELFDLRQRRDATGSGAAILFAKIKQQQRR